MRLDLLAFQTDGLEANIVGSSIIKSNCYTIRQIVATKTFLQAILPQFILIKDTVVAICRRISPLIASYDVELCHQYKMEKEEQCSE